MEIANRESSTSWKDFLLGLKTRGLRGVIFAVSDDHPGLKRAIMEVVPEAYWQRCYVHFSRNALDGIIRAKAVTTVSSNCDGFMIGATPPKPAEIWRHGWFAGRRNIRKFARGSKKTLMKP